LEKVINEIHPNIMDRVVHEYSICKSLIDKGRFAEIEIRNKKMERCGNQQGNKRPPVIFETQNKRNWN
jgi:hypothetical protein